MSVFNHLFKDRGNRVSTIAVPPEDEARRSNKKSVRCDPCPRLAAIALVVLQSEEEAFWCVVAVVDAIMPQDYYSKNLLAAQVRKRLALESGHRQPLDRLIDRCPPMTGGPARSEGLPGGEASSAGGAL